MTDPLTVIPSLLSALRPLPLWIMGGLALAGLAILYAPSFGGVNPGGFRQTYGIWVWAGTILSAVLAFARLMDFGVASYIQRRGMRLSSSLRLFPGDRPWWLLSKQPDGSYVTQMNLEIKVVNTASGSVRFMNARLVRPKVATEDLLQINIGEEHPVLPGQIAEVHVHIMVRKALGTVGNKLPVVIGLTDHRGHEYRVKAVLASN